MFQHNKVLNLIVEFSGVDVQFSLKKNNNKN